MSTHAALQILGYRSYKWIARFAPSRTAVLLATCLTVLGCDSSNRDELPDYGYLAEKRFGHEGGHLRPAIDTMAVGEFEGQPIRWITNSKGFRNETEFAYSAADGTFRILLIGDSYVDGMRVDQARTLGHQLDRFLETSMSPGHIERVEVLNAGLNNPIDYWYYYQKHGWKYRPDLVVVGLTFGNDLTWLTTPDYLAIETSASGEARIHRARARLGDNRVDKYTLRHPLLLPPEAYVPPSPTDWVVDVEFEIRDYASATLRPLRDIAPPRSAPFPNERRRVFANGFLISLGIFYQPVMPPINENISYVERVLKGFGEMVRRNGARFLVLFFPVRVQAYPSDMRLVSRQYSLDPDRFDMDYPNRRLGAFCERNDLDCLDLTPVLREFAASSDEKLYFSRGDMHLSGLGYEVSARAVSEWILEHVLPRVDR